MHFCMYERRKVKLKEPDSKKRNLSEAKSQAAQAHKNVFRSAVGSKAAKTRFQFRVFKTRMFKTVV